MRFTFRADGSSTIGFGHLSRTMALADAARRAGADVVFVGARGEASTEAFVRKRGFELSIIDVLPGSSDDAAATRAIAGPCSYVVVDGYAFSAAWLSELRGDDRIVVYIDDWAREQFACEVVVNPNVSGKRSLYRVAPGTSLLAGPEYAIVHDRFVRARARKLPRAGPVDRLLITMGASDPPGATLWALEALGSLDAQRLNVRVIVGAANPRRAAVIAAASARSEHSLQVCTAVDDMAEQMLWADVVLTASGVTASEVACVGVPGVSVAIADNQAPIAAELARLGLFDVLELAAAGPDAIQAALERILVDDRRRADQVEAQREVVDGAGKDRVVSRLLALRASDRHNPREGGDDD